MQKERLEKIMEMGYFIGFKSKYLENNANKIMLLNLVSHKQYEDFYNKIMQIATQAEAEVPTEIAKFKTYDEKEDFIRASHCLLLGIQNGSLTRQDNKIQEKIGD